MNTERRLSVLESDLAGQERAIAWLKRVQAIGGFVDYCAALAKAKAPQLDADEEAPAFIFSVVVQCNVQVLEMAVPNERLPLFALYLLRIEHSEMVPANPLELERLPQLLKTFIAEGQVLAGACKQVSRVHLAGNQALFRDTEQKLAERNRVATELLEVYNEVAPKRGFDMIQDEDIESSVFAQVAKKTEVLEKLARADALAHLGDSYSSRALLLPLIVPTDGATGLTTEANS